MVDRRRSHILRRMASPIAPFLTQAHFALVLLALAALVGLGVAAALATAGGLLLADTVASTLLAQRAIARQGGKR